MNLYIWQYTSLHLQAPFIAVLKTCPYTPQTSKCNWEMCTTEKMVLPNASLGNMYLKLEIIITIALLDF
jgi:hypothetical protein